MALLSDFFGKKLSQAQQDFYFKDLKYISKDSFDHAVRATMRGRKPNPGNFPTIEEVQALCPKQQSDINYNSDENEMDYYKRITVNDLWEALSILQKRSHDHFLRYCQSKNISDEDIERVEWKHKYAITADKIMNKLAKERGNHEKAD